MLNEGLALRKETTILPSAETICSALYMLLIGTLSTMTLDRPYQSREGGRKWLPQQITAAFALLEAISQRQKTMFMPLANADDFCTRDILAEPTLRGIDVLVPLLFLKRTAIIAVTHQEMLSSTLNRLPYE